MIKKTVTYEDFNGVEKTVDLWFHLSKAELIEMQLASNNEYADLLQRIAKSQNGADIMREFKHLIKASFGVRSADGESFFKSDAQSEGFMQSAAYDALFTELVTDANFAVQFCEGVLPAKLVAEVKSQTENLSPERLAELTAKQYPRV